KPIVVAAALREGLEQEAWSDNQLCAPVRIDRAAQRILQLFAGGEQGRAGRAGLNLVAEQGHGAEIQRQLASGAEIERAFGEQGGPHFRHARVLAGDFTQTLEQEGAGLEIVVRALSGRPNLRQQLAGLAGVEAAQVVFAADVVAEVVEVV